MLTRNEERKELNEFLKDKLGFVGKIFGSAYSESVVSDAYNTVPVDVLKSLEVKKDELETMRKELTDLSNKYDLNLKKTSKLNSELLGVKTELGREKRTISDMKLADKTTEYKGIISQLEATIKKNSNNATLKLNSELKKVTDAFMKKIEAIEKRTKEKQVLKKKNKSGRKGVRKLTDKQVIEIREKCNTPEDHIFYASKHSVNVSTIKRITTGQTYKNVK